MKTEQHELSFEEYHIEEEPYYLPIADEVTIFKAAFQAKIPVLLKGPTGTGKTRFVEYMSYLLSRDMSIKQKDGNQFLPLITVACHEDLTTTDLVGKFLLKGDETVWVDGPLTLAVGKGAICYLDEIVEARKDTTVIIHPLSDHRRLLPIDKKGTIIEAHPNFFLVISYNPGYQSLIKDLKQSTKQRFIAIDFDYPVREQEAQIIQHESDINQEVAYDLAKLGEKIRHLKGHALVEGASTRLLIYCGKLIKGGISPRKACEVALTAVLTDEKEIQRAINEVVSSIFT
ncbi:MAG: CbbQ/NirQ/NorQ/GpvN family protein [Deltaproteobacteria bacterium]|jgi:nitric oxide reductase NorQ protein|nr:CbbQ/NirQ/NorQ/GpvN family protein [Deltaproteobacteria bacterium]MBT4638771.1 CbbQ/NirQ/NorQ/GpvN family protein [Deltaproteobacteria bacterium]MBT6500580.1 CbbQ/NirQ/NorQ/GpvN family protein [Deltaproteobacteria bacterium]MBT7152314.1 CbbQ/NirQ/NorQ/GpvN family protein [Deltaproteobacteria bacterium]MBT7715718.1 CbbQ/NirQ/NorQ/GpvN family protein [Deltaproteobacteria bacterium]